MASNLVPILSTSPPPLDGESFEEEEDDEFGEFTAVPRFDVVADTSPEESAKGTPGNVSNEHTESLKSVAVNGLSEDDGDDFGDFSCFGDHFPENGDIPDSTSGFGSSGAPHSRNTLEQSKEFRKVCFSDSVVSNGASTSSKVVEFLPSVDGSSDSVRYIDDIDEKLNADGICGQDDIRGFWRSDPPDNTSQDSATDSGLCSGSQRSDASPLPHPEGVADAQEPHFKLDTNCVNETNQGKSGMADAVSSVDSVNSEPVNNPKPSLKVLTAQETSTGVEITSEASVDDSADFSKVAVPELSVIGHGNEDDDLDEFGGFSGVSYSEDFSSAKDLSLVTNDDAAMETARTSLDSSGGSFKGEGLGTPGDDLSPLPDDIVTSSDCDLHCNSAQPLEGGESDRFHIADQLPLSSVKVEGLSGDPSESCQNNDDQWNEFGDFEAAPSSVRAASTTRASHSADDTSALVLAQRQDPLRTDDDFADFEQMEFESPEDEFADFSSASFHEPSCSKPRTEAILAAPHQEVSEAPSVLVQLIAAAFPASSPVSSNEATFPCSENVDNLILGIKPSKSRILWDQLQDFDSTPALCYRWPNSHVFQQVLQALDIDSRNILRNPSIPIFASLGLGLLEPVKGPLIETAAAEDTVPSTNTSEMVIPPVHFDWSGSGLINPLECEGASSVLLDLDFFYTNDPTLRESPERAPKTSSLEDELLGPDPVVSPRRALSGNDLEKLLSSSKTTILPQQPSRPADMSDEATQVLDQLPDLSFMQAKVLMFPIKEAS